MQLPGRKNGRKLVREITAESIYRCMLLFLDHILCRRAHFVRDALRASRAVLAIKMLAIPDLSVLVLVSSIVFLVYIARMNIYNILQIVPDVGITNWTRVVTNFTILCLNR